MRADAASAAGPSRGGGVIVRSIRPKLVPVHISLLQCDLYEEIKEDEAFATINPDDQLGLCWKQEMRKCR
jgi:hypothetical protein